MQIIFPILKILVLTSEQSKLFISYIIEKGLKTNNFFLNL